MSKTPPKLHRDLCKICGANLAMVGIRHRCVPSSLTIPVHVTPMTAKTQRAADLKEAIAKANKKPPAPPKKARSSMVEHSAPVTSRSGKRTAAGSNPAGPTIPITATTPGRPRIGEPSPGEPWVALGMSRRTYYRRKAELK